MFLAQQRTTFVLAPPPLLIEFDEPKLRVQSDADESVKQVVRTRQLDNDRAPEKEAYLGEKNQTADRQTVASEGALSGGGPPRATQRKRALDVSKFGVQILPSTVQRQTMSGAGGTVQEYVTGVKEGQDTALSTREYVFFGYFERIRGRLDRAWEPILREQLLRHYRQGRHLASEMDHRTEVLVVLDEQGRVIDVEIVGESGTETLDSAAVQAFNRAGPFPNPPRGLIGPDRKVKIKWEFILKT